MFSSYISRQADLGFSVQVKGLATQGAYASQEWVKKYKLQFSGDGHDWKAYPEVRLVELFKL